MSEMCLSEFKKHFSLNWLDIKMRYTRAQFDKRGLSMWNLLNWVVVKQYLKTENGRHEPRVTRLWRRISPRSHVALNFQSLLRPPVHQQAGLHSSGSTGPGGCCRCKHGQIPAFHQHKICICNSVTQALTRINRDHRYGNADTLKGDSAVLLCAMSKPAHVLSISPLRTFSFPPSADVVHVGSRPQEKTSSDELSHGGPTGWKRGSSPAGAGNPTPPGFYGSWISAGCGGARTSLTFAGQGWQEGSVKGAGPHPELLIEETPDCWRRLDGNTILQEQPQWITTR